MPSSDKSPDRANLQILPMATEGQQDVGREVAEAQVAPEASTSEKIFSTVKSMLLRGMVIYFIMSLFRRPQQPTNNASNGQVSTAKGAATNLFALGTEMDFYVFVSEQVEFGDFNNSEALVWTKKGLSYGDWDSGPNGDATYSASKAFPVSERVQNNGSIYMHAFVVQAGKSPDPSTGKGRFSKKWTVHKYYQLNKWKKKSYKKTANLLTGQTEATEEEQAKVAEGVKQEIISHWHPNITVNIVCDHTPWVPGQVPPPLDEFVEFTPSMQNYKPILFVNDYWNMNKDYQLLNDTVKELNLTITFQPLSMFKWQMYSAQQMRNRFNMLGNLMGDEDEGDQDSIKEAFLETNPYLLGLTFVVSIVHSVFEFLAFKNDIQFWNKRKSMEGLSVRSVFFNVFQSLIVLLYVLDNETNTVIKISCLVGLGIEIWKINKVVDVSVDHDRQFLGVFPRVVFTDKGSYEESGTKEFDRMAFKYLGILLFPLGIGYIVYTVIYNEHSGWYSFILSSCYGFLLTFGFIMMTPQLFINYKLKSVAHLPWRMMTYKALNTFIDDIFAFVIKMPTMYRIGCFRDDIVFFIFLYQRYIYRVDKSRVNEFGVSGEMLEENEKEAIEKKGGDETAAAPPAAIENEIKDVANEEKSAEEKKTD